MASAKTTTGAPSGQKLQAHAKAHLQNAYAAVHISEYADAFEWIDRATHTIKELRERFENGE